MEDKKITIDLSPLMAGVIQRLLVDEINNQNRWMEEEMEEFGTTNADTRKKIIFQCEELRSQLADKGIKKYFKCY